MKVAKRQKGFANLAGTHELTEQELEAVIGGAAAPSGDYEFVVDTPDARFTYGAHITDGKNFKSDGVIKSDYGTGKNPYYKAGGVNVHTIDLTNLK
jgi:bacteriocin-like protein